jgi:hypothetical protein
MAITDFLTNPTTIAELAALLVALFFLLQKKAGYWQLFVMYAGVLLLAELVGFYMRTVLVQPNHVVYNLLMLLQAAFFLYLLYRFHESEQWQKYIVLAAIAFVLLYISESVVQEFAAYNKYSRQFMALLIVLFSCTFYFTLLKNDQVKSPLSFPNFWIVTGLFVYYFGTFVIFVFYSEVSKIKLTGNLSFYTFVVGSLSFILYGSWIIGFIWKKKQLQSS